MFLPNLPLPDRREAGVEHRREDCLTELVSFSQGADLLTVILWDGRKAQCIIRTHPALVDAARRVKISGSLVDRVRSNSNGVKSVLNRKKLKLSPEIQQRWLNIIEAFTEELGSKPCPL
jgi:hypothetical protein